MSTDSEPQADPQPSAFDLLGGEPGVRQLVDRFYDLMDLDERFVHLRSLHPNVLDGSRDKLFWFCAAGWAARPFERFGHQLAGPSSAFPIARANATTGCCAWPRPWLTGRARAAARPAAQAFNGTADWTHQPARCRGPPHHAVVGAGDGAAGALRPSSGCAAARRRRAAPGVARRGLALVPAQREAARCTARSREIATGAGVRPH
jgi:hemoglobin